MADPQEVADRPKLYEDPVTKEMISKNELKKRQKQREVDQKKAEKKAATSDKQPAEGQPKEEELNPNQYHELRSRDIRALRASKAPNPYPHKFQETISVGEFREKYKHLKKGETLPDVEVACGAKIINIRTSGAKLHFLEVTGRDGVSRASVQIMCTASDAQGPSFADQHHHLRRGDRIGVVGYPGKTNPQKRDDGELSIFAKTVILLAPSLHQLPSTLTDKETRYRQRYLDFQVNASSREKMIKRRSIMRYLERYLDDRDFLKVNTPMMSQLAGGAAARPFETYHNDLNMKLFMRIAPELDLKRLVVGGFDRVYEIGEQFRNEDIDLTHNPEFTTLEFYAAHFDMYDVLQLTEEMLSGLVKEVTGSFITKWHDKDGKEFEMNWEAPWRRIDMIPALEELTHTKFPPPDQFHTEESFQFFKSLLAKMGMECSPPLTASRMIDKMVGEYLESQCINPTFIIGHPKVMSPLAKEHRDIPGLTERFEAFVCTKEICNAYTELNDPFDQRERFEQQAQDKARGDHEAQPIDEDFITALEHGLPPTGGFGLGIDRLVMFLTDTYSIKEVLAFPMMKPINDGEGATKAQAAVVEAVEAAGTVLGTEVHH